VIVARDRFATERTNVVFGSTMLFTNCDLELGNLDGALAVIDGDITRWAYRESEAALMMWDATVIVRGSVLSEPALSGERVAVSIGGNFGARTTGDLKDVAVFAGGTAKISGKKENIPAIIKSNVKENPFGVRFFETDELGVRAEDADGGARLVRVDATSVLAAHGLKTGDVVFRIDETRVPNAKEFRRELRRAAVNGNGVFWVRGDGARQTRVVHFGNVFGR
jgi:hypothetical protein